VCPDAAALQAAVSKRLDYDPFGPAGRQAIIVEIIDDEDELRAQMRLVDERGVIVGSRELREKTEQCDELVASLALAISIALDPSAALGEAPASPAKIAPAGSPVERPAKSTHDAVAQLPPFQTNTTEAPSPEAPPAAHEPLQFAARAALFADVGSAPALGFGWRLGMDLHHGSFRLAAEFSQLLPTSKNIPQDGIATASLLAGTLAPCLATNVFAGCGLVSVGALNTRGESIPNASRQSSSYAALGARLEYTPVLFKKLQLLTQLDAVKPLTPVSLRVYGDEVWRSPVCTFAASVGLRWRFQ